MIKLLYKKHFLHVLKKTNRGIQNDDLKAKPEGGK